MKQFSDNWQSASSDVKRVHVQEGLIESLSKAVREALKAKRVNQVELARRLGKTEGYVSQILNGGNLTLRTIADICFAIGVEVGARFNDREGTLQVVAVNLPLKFSDRAANIEAFIGRRPIVSALTPNSNQTLQQRKVA